MDPPTASSNDTTLVIRAEKQELTAKHQAEMSAANSVVNQAHRMTLSCFETLKQTSQDLINTQKELADCKRKLEVFEDNAKRARLTSFCEKDLFPVGTDHKYKVDQLKHLIAPDCPAYALTQKGFKAALEFLGESQAAIDAKTKVAKCNKDRMDVVKTCVKARVDENRL
jgi:hypothetical protein